MIKINLFQNNNLNLTFFFLKASSSDGKEQLEKNSSTQAISENSLTSTSTDLKSDIEAAHSSNKIIIDDTQTKSSPKSTIVTTSTSGLKINLQNLPLNTTSIIKNLPNPTTLTSSVNNISNIYSLMLSQNQQQSTGSGIPGGLKHSVLSQPNLPIVTMMSGKNGNGNGNFNNCKGSNKIVITNSGGINPNGGHSSTRIITTTSPATSTCSSVDNLPKSMPSSLKSSIITSATSSNATSSSSSLNLKSMSPISFTSATDSKASLIKGSANIKQLSQSVISPQTQTVQLVNNIVNFSTSNIIPVGQSSPSQNYKQQHKISATHSSFIIPQLISPIHSQTQQNSRSSIVVNAVDNIAISNQPNAFNNLEQNQASPSVNVNSPTASPIKPNIIRKSRLF